MNPSPRGRRIAYCFPAQFGDRARGTGRERAALYPPSVQMSMPAASAGTVTVRYFASLRETLGRDQDVLPLTANTTVAEIWERVAGKPAEGRRVLAAVNAEYADFGAAVAPGDEVAFFPPVTGG